MLAASTALAIAQGDIATPVGWIGLGLAVLATAGLVVIARQALRTGEVVDRALIARRTASSVEATPALGPDRVLAVRLFRTLASSASRTSSYGDAGRGNLLDVYCDRSRPAGGPMLIHLHGGAFRIGNKSREGRPLFYRLARRGWVCISANYRLRGAVPGSARRREEGDRLGS